MLVTAAAIFLLNVLLDILYALLDPRIRHHLHLVELARRPLGDRMHVVELDA